MFPSSPFKNCLCSCMYKDVWTYPNTTKDVKRYAISELCFRPPCYKNIDTGMFILNKVTFYVGWQWDHNQQLLPCSHHKPSLCLSQLYGTHWNLTCVRLTLLAHLNLGLRAQCSLQLMTARNSTARAIHRFWFAACQRRNALQIILYCIVRYHLQLFCMESVAKLPTSTDHQWH